MSSVVFWVRPPTNIFSLSDPPRWNRRCSLNGIPAFAFGPAVPAKLTGAGAKEGASMAARSLPELGVAGSLGTWAAKMPSAVMPTMPSPTTSSRSATGRNAHGSCAMSCVPESSSAWKKNARASCTSFPPVRSTYSTASFHRAVLSTRTRGSVQGTGPWPSFGRVCQISCRHRFAHGDRIRRSVTERSRGTMERISRSRRNLRRSSTRSSRFFSSSSGGFVSASVTSSLSPLTSW
mmetsp:Transcript_47572/g.142131  ORF Transcript_47572/g.142131 Transcript_47572/m.142131 type:complete len:235 (-) Transcript_47572:564-1268(-)